MLHIDIDEIHRVKAKWELYYISASSFEQILEVTPHKKHLYSQLPQISQNMQVRHACKNIIITIVNSIEIWYWNWVDICLGICIEEYCHTTIENEEWFLVLLFKHN